MPFMEKAILLDGSHPQTGFGRHASLRVLMVRHRPVMFGPGMKGLRISVVARSGVCYAGSVSRVVRTAVSGFPHHVTQRVMIANHETHERNTQMDGS